MTKGCILLGKIDFSLGKPSLHHLLLYFWTGDWGDYHISFIHEGTIYCASLALMYFWSVLSLAERIVKVLGLVHLHIQAIQDGIQDVKLCPARIIICSVWHGVECLLQLVCSNDPCAHLCLFVDFCMHWWTIFYCVCMYMHSEAYIYTNDCVSQCAHTIWFWSSEARCTAREITLADFTLCVKATS